MTGGEKEGEQREIKKEKRGNHEKGTRGKEKTRKGREKEKTKKRNEEKRKQRKRAIEEHGTTKPEKRKR